MDPLAKDYNISNYTAKNNLELNKTKAKQNSPSFQGLTSIAKKTIYPNADTLRAMAKITNTTTIGSLPSEFIKKIKSLDKSDISTEIKAIQESFAQASQKLDEINILSKKSLEDVIAGDEKGQLAKYAEAIRNVAQSKDADHYNNIYIGLRNVRWVDKATASKIKDEARNILETAFKKQGLIGEKDSIKIKDLGEGMFGHCYKISFFDEDGKKLFTDKVIKVFKNEELEKEFMVNAKVLETQVLKKNGDTLSKYIEMKAKGANPRQRYIFDEIKYYKKQKESSIQFNDGLTTDLIKKMERSQVDADFYKLEKQHGAVREANSAAYIKKAMGHSMQNSDITPQYLFDIKNNYALSEFATKTNNLKTTDFERLGLYSVDGASDGNYINGKLVDLGGMIVDDKNIVNDPIVRRINKIFTRETDSSKKADLWNSYYKKVQDNKISNKESVMTALTISLEKMNYNELRKLDISSYELQRLSNKAYQKLFYC